MTGSLRESRVLITGGAGLIGSHVADLVCAAEAAEVVIYDNLSRGRIENLANARATGRVTLVNADVRNREELGRAFEGMDLIIHLAAIRLTQCAEDPRLALEVMADGTFNVVEAAVAAGVKKLVAASSASIYGMAQEFPTREDHHAYDNDTIYGAAKLFNEGVLRAFAVTHGLKYVALRPFNVYGPRMDTQGAYTEVLVRWMERIARGLPPLIFGDGSQSMDFIFVEDVARAFVLAATSAQSNQVFNIASGTETTLKQLADGVLRAMDSQLPVEYGPERKINPVPRRLADTRYAKERLGFEARIDMEEGLRRLVAWWKAETA